MPPNAVYVGRPTVFGNPFVPGRYFMRGDPYPKSAGLFGMLWCEGPSTDPRMTKLTAVEAVEWYRWWAGIYPSIRDSLPSLRGKDLACWCPLIDKQGEPVPCHADVLLAIANGGEL